jgi:hypothetical protein
MGDFEEYGKLTYLKDAKYKKTGVAYYSSANRESLVKLLKLHNTRVGGHYIRTFLMGFTYDADEYTEHLYDNFKGQKMLDDEYDEEDVELVDKLDD